MPAFEGQVSIVTGAARGLGLAFAERLAAEGMRVVACDVRESVRDVGSLGVVADVSNPEDVRRVVDRTIADFGRVDLLVNNAGVVRATKIGGDFDRAVEDFDAQVGPNFKGVYLFGRAVAPTMIAQGSGHIVNVSTDHVYPTPKHAVWAHGGLDVYNASKWALNGLTLDWAETLRRKGVRCNALCMGATDTPMMRSFSGEVSPEVEATWMKAEEIAGWLVQLHAEGPEGRTGHNVGLWIDRPRSLDDSRVIGDRP